MSPKGRARDVLQAGCGCTTSPVASRCCAKGLTAGHFRLLLQSSQTGFHVPISDAPGSPWAPLGAITAHTVPSYIATLGEKIRAVRRCRLAVFFHFYPHHKQVLLC